MLHTNTRMPPLLRRVAPVPVALLIAACAISAQGTSAWSLRGPTTEIGRAGIDLHRVRGAALLPGGRIAIADAGNTRILVVERSGALFKAIGQVGGGPADFQMIYRLAAVGDTIVVWDTGLSRIALWRGDGTFLRTVPLAAEAGRVVDLQAVLSTTQYVVTTRGGAIPPRSGLFHDTLPVFALDAGTGSMRPLGSREWSLSFVDVTGGGSSVYNTPFLGTTLAAASRGHLFVLPLGRRQVEVTSPDGVRSTVELPVTLRAHDRARVADYRDSLLALVEPTQLQMRERISRVFGAEFPVPRYAAVAQRAVAVGSAVWFQGYPDSPDARATWYAVSAAPTRVVAQIDLPRDWVVLGGDDNTVLVLQRDDLGVERVSVYTVDKPPR